MAEGDFPADPTLLEAPILPMAIDFLPRTLFLRGLQFDRPLGNFRSLLSIVARSLVLYSKEKFFDPKKGILALLIAEGTC